MFYRPYVSTVLLLLFVSPLRAQIWTLTSADLKTSYVKLKTISTEAVVTGDETIRLDKLFSLRRRAKLKPTSSFILRLVNGDRYSGEPGPLVNESLTWVNPQFGTLNVPITQLAAITRGDEPAPLDEPPKQDLATLQNGDTVAGVFADCRDKQLTIQTEAASTIVPLANLSRLIFAATGSSPASPAKPAFRIELTDATVVTCSSVTSDGNVLKITMRDFPAKAVDVSLSQVLAIERVNGSAKWLSPNELVGAVQQDYFGRENRWPARFDATFEGKPLRFERQLFDHGIAVHAQSKLMFTIDPVWKSFQTRYAIEAPPDGAEPLADVTVRILTDGTQVHEHQHFRQGELSTPIMVELNGVKTLTLECDFGNTGSVQARLDWLQPALMRAAPTDHASKVPPAARGS